MSRRAGSRVRAVPRGFPREAAGNPIIGEGKPENQNQAVIFGAEPTCRRLT